MNKIVGLNTLRFFSFLWIFLFHTTSSFQFGYLGVDFFFVISSFLLTLLALKEIDKTGSFKKFNFFMRRSLRIFPLYFLVIIFTFFVLPIISSYFEFTPKLPENKYLYWLFLSNYDSCDCIFSLGFLWSIAVEEQFYIIFLIFSFLLSRNVILLVVLIMLGYLGFALYAIEYQVSTYTHTFSYLANFAIGIFGAFLFFKPKAKYVPFVSLLISIIVVYFSKDEFIIKIFISIAFLSIIFLTIRYTPRIKHFLLFKATEKLGEYTYGLYVYSGFVITFMLKQSFLKDPILVVVVEFLITLGIAMLSYHLYEKHFLKLKKHFR